ncbi:ABC transporter ATP-binding protein [Colwellia sp. MB02u-18]|uniref:ABC transporter ATP-binding protein n=1 Tax=unclassified Colwellia TaxID=196834 RepID=UPI0015F5364D|nr:MULTISPECIES: ABC transporter ATP-binding protein [unclassified Colwellia]MBA6224102.1 ABC transporter ATP-binding protein [Colwellia sp. MB3u-45]MBA6269006.1 ABC transporter ATP-binding protein [Colwellia sp. MB3u-43]MBA6320908.1 ABC transporter ATP-binding protein [Colwellia sp. MB02u-19]MBA6324188.1 ABC transporter ATP-binding protein [Colwellia sp. MB02u-18]MBA6332737.1 ABC transporter ATP-binding protein [Colwellia sp. MB02u-12]
MHVNSESILSVKDLTKSVQVEDKTLVLLQPLNLTVAAGESIAIVGSSGSGKTTLLSILAGLDLPSSGQVYLKNQPLHQFNEEQRSQVRAQHVGFIFQQFLLINSLTALENVMLPAELANMPDAQARGEALLAQVGLADRMEHYPSQLSGGEQQRVAIARAFIAKPDILFADEPTGNLDSKTGQHIIDLIFDLNVKEGTTLVLVTHDAKLAARCQRQVEMDSGALTEPLTEATLANTDENHAKNQADTQTTRHDDLASKTSVSQVG